MEVRKFDYEIERAVEFLVNAIQETGHNPKPVILHSVRVGMYLYEQDCGPEVVIAGLLHDLLEDTETSIHEIENEFGSNVSELVWANSYDVSLPRPQRDIELVDRCSRHGFDALLIKGADILDNSFYYPIGRDDPASKWFLPTMKRFLDASASELKDQTTWQKLSQRYHELLSDGATE